MNSIPLIKAEQAQAPMDTTAECPLVQVIAITDTLVEETSMRLMADNNALLNQVRPIAETRDPTVEFLVGAPSRNTAKTKMSQKCASKNQIVMMVKEL